MSVRLPIAAVLLLSACARAPAPAPPRPRPVLPQPPPSTECPGGLLCEAPTPVDGWRVPQPCQPTRLGQRVVTCWMANERWPRVVEFFQSRYPQTSVSGPTLRIAGQGPMPAGLTPPLLLAHERPQGVELVLLAGDPVDTPRPATETAPASSALPRRAP